jgi:hypothetical protein
MPFEHHKEPLLPRYQFVARMVSFGLFALLLVVASLLLGVVGYHALEGLPWIDSLLNASMILGGMGPVDHLYTAGGKLFASFYALFSGVVFLISVGILIAPAVHRLMHRFHLQSAQE